MQSSKYLFFRKIISVVSAGKNIPTDSTQPTQPNRLNPTDSTQPTQPNRLNPTDSTQPTPKATGRNPTDAQATGVNRAQDGAKSSSPLQLNKKQKRPLAAPVLPMKSAKREPEKRTDKAKQNSKNQTSGLSMQRKRRGDVSSLSPNVARLVKSPL